MNDEELNPILFLFKCMEELKPVQDASLPSFSSKMFVKFRFFFKNGRTSIKLLLKFFIAENLPVFLSSGNQVQRNFKFEIADNYTYDALLAISNNNLSWINLTFYLSHLIKRSIKRQEEASLSL